MDKFQEVLDIITQVFTMLVAFVKDIIAIVKDENTETTAA